MHNESPMHDTRSQRVLTIGPYEISMGERVLRRRGLSVAISPKAADVLLVLLANRERFVSKSELLDCVWPDADVNESNLTQSIYLLRGLFKKHGDPVVIENIPKRGYRLTECVASPPRFTFFAPRAFIVAGAALALVIVAFTALHGSRSDASVNASADREYVLARAYQDGGTPADLQRSAQLFERVTRMQPNDARAYAGLSETETSLTFYASDSARRSRLEGDARRRAEQAVRLDPESPQAQSAIGAVDLWLRHDPGGAAPHLARAIELQPSAVDALAWYGSALISLGRPVEARSVFRRAVALAPNAPGAVASLAWSEFLAGDYDAAAAFSWRELRSGHDSGLSLLILANAYLRARDFTRARSTIERLAHDRTAAVQAQALFAQLDALSGAKGRALHRLLSLEKSVRPRTAGSWDASAIAAAYLASGERARAIEWLTAVPRWDRAEVASDPRFASLKPI